MYNKSYGNQNVDWKRSDIGPNKPESICNKNISRKSSSPHVFFSSPRTVHMMDMMVRFENSIHSPKSEIFITIYNFYNY